TKFARGSAVLCLSVAQNVLCRRGPAVLALDLGAVAQEIHGRGVLAGVGAILLPPGIEAGDVYSLVFRRSGRVALHVVIGGPSLHRIGIGLIAIGVVVIGDLQIPVEVEVALITAAHENAGIGAWLTHGAVRSGRRIFR